jgi:hypothetical protein
MKTITKLFIILLFAFGVKADAQITLLNTYPSPQGPNNFQLVYLKHDGFKFVNLHYDTLSFYNVNLSLFRNAIIPGHWMLGYYTVQCISEGLFDTDTLHIDYMVTAGSFCQGCPDSVVIYKDNGNAVFRKDSAAFGVVGFSSMQGPVFSPIMSTDSGTFMALILVSNYSTQLYKLPGSLPCVPGCAGDNIYTSMPEISNNSNAAIKAYPNPAVSYTNIYYTLPPGTNEGELILYDLAGRNLKKYTVTSQFDHLRLTTSDIAAGTYFYQLTVNGNSISTKKIVVVK